MRVVVLFREEDQSLVPTVRRPLEDGDPYFERGEPDMAPPDAFVECGMFGEHGFMAECVTMSPEHLVAVPTGIADRGCLIEPTSVCEKAPGDDSAVIVHVEP